jgi:hypothetical protein
LSAAQQATTKWRSKLSAEDTHTALEQARAWQGKLFAWLSPAWWRLRKVLNEAYDFKAHAVRPTWTQVLLALNDEYVAQKEVEQCIAATKAQFGGEHEPTRLEQELTSLRANVAKLPDWLRRIHTAMLKSPKAESIVDQSLAAADSHAGCCMTLDAVIADFESLPLETLRAELAAVRGALRQVPQALSVLKEGDKHELGHPITPRDNGDRRIGFVALCAEGRRD